MKASCCKFSLRILALVVLGLSHRRGIGYLRASTDRMQQEMAKALSTLAPAPSTSTSTSTSLVRESRESRGRTWATQSALLIQRATALTEKQDLSVYLTSRYTREYPLHDFVAGPAAPYYQDETSNGIIVIPMAHQSQAVCEFRPTINGSHHFPHSMQQLYRCFSWWHANPGQKPILLLEAIPNAYVEGFVHALQDVFGLSVRKGSLEPNLTKISVYTKTQGTHKPNTPKEKIMYQMHSTKDAEVMRRGIFQYYNFSKSMDHWDEETLPGCPSTNPSKSRKQNPIILFLNRKGGRHVTNHEPILRAVKTAFQHPPATHHTNSTTTTTTFYEPGPISKNNFTVRYLDSFDNKTFLEQVKFMSQVDIVISPHGAQLTSSAFMPKCGGILELFPRGHHFPQPFGTLAAATGHHHLSLYTGSRNNRTHECQLARSSPPQRKIIRAEPIVAHPEMVALAVQELALQWHLCCDNLPSEGTGSYHHVDKCLG